MSKERNSLVMGKNTAENVSGNPDACSWNIDDALRSLRDADKKIGEFLEQKKKPEKSKGGPGNEQEPEASAS